MENRHFDREELQFKSLSKRPSQVVIANEQVTASDTPAPLPEETMEVIRQTAHDLIEAKRKGASRILTFGTYVIRNGLGPLIGEFVQRGWLTHLATTGTSVVDDWEFAYQGVACEDTRTNLPEGRFGMWQQTNYYINLAILIGARDGLGLGESVGRMIASQSGIPNFTRTKGWEIKIS